MPTLLALDTGARRGELLGLEWDEVYLDRRKVRFRQQNAHVPVALGEKRPEICVPKSRASRRTIAISQRTVDALSRYRASELCAADSPYVFSRPDGSLENPNSFTTWMERRLTKIVGIPGLHPHALRHTHASHLLARGVPLADVAHRIGHANVNTLTKIYAHAIPVDDVGIADVWDTVEPDDE